MDEAFPGSTEKRAEEGFGAEDIVAILRELKVEGVDLEDEDLEHLLEMAPDEALEYFIVAASEAGHDAEVILIEKGIALDIEDNPEEVVELQNSGEPYTSQQADELVQPREQGDT